jgi:hypothetical protein
MPITAVYVRVSTTGQNEAGQRREIARWLKGNEIDDVRWFVDKKTWSVFPLFIVLTVETCYISGSGTERWHGTRDPDANH